MTTGQAWNIERYRDIAQEAHDDGGWSTGELADIIETLCDEVSSSRAALAAEREESGRLRAELRNVLSSACPNRRDHPAMSAAWERAEKALAKEEP